MLRGGHNAAVVHRRIPVGAKNDIYNTTNTCGVYYMHEEDKEGINVQNRVYIHIYYGNPTEKRLMRVINIYFLKHKHTSTSGFSEGKSDKYSETCKDENGFFPNCAPRIQLILVSHVFVLENLQVRQAPLFWVQQCNCQDESVYRGEKLFKKKIITNLYTPKRSVQKCV